MSSIHLFNILSGTRVKVIASIAHFLVVERSYRFNILRQAPLQIDLLLPSLAFLPP